MITFKELQNKANECLASALETFIEEKQIPPFFFGVADDGELTYHDVETETEENHNNIPKILNEMAWAYPAIIVIANLLVNAPDKNARIEDDDEYIKDIENHPDTASAIFCFIYTKEKGMFRQFQYDPDNFVIYYRSDWNRLKVERTKLFLNPFDQINIAESI